MTEQENAQKTEETVAEDAQIAEAATEEKKEAVELSDKASAILEDVKSLSVMELANLVKALEEEFGVSAQAAVMAPMAGGMPAGGGGAAAAAAEEKTSFDVVLASVGDKKIQVIKEIRGITSLGLKEAKDLVEAAPKAIKEGVTKEEAEDIKAKVEAVGATVEIK